MDMPFTHRDPRFTMWSKSPSMEISLPSRTEATMPQPQEQKLQEVVNSLTSESFNFCVPARTASTSTRAPSASPAHPPAAALNHSRRVTCVGVLGDSLALVATGAPIPHSPLLLGSKACSIPHETELTTHRSIRQRPHLPKTMTLSETIVVTSSDTVAPEAHCWTVSRRLGLQSIRGQLGKSLGDFARCSKYSSFRESLSEILLSARSVGMFSLRGGFRSLNRKVRPSDRRRN